jgi:Stage II sporulation protein E (SpoIIE)
MRISCGLLLLVLLTVPLGAQTVDLSGLGTGTKSLAGFWKFHAGDDPRWADPNFDDSHWNLVKVPLSLNQQGYPDFAGYGWYRLTLQRPAQDAPLDLSLAVIAITNVAEFYANGVSFGRFGEFPPYPRVYYPRPLWFRLPAERWRGSRLVLAIRIWVDKRFGFWKQSGLIDAPDTGSPAPAIGVPAVIDNLTAAHQRVRELSQLPGGLVKCAELILALYLLGLYFTESRRPEYLWLSITFAGEVVFWVSSWISGSTFLLTANADLLLNWLLSPVVLATALLGIWATCEEKIGPLPKVLMVGVFLANLSTIVMFEGGLLSPGPRGDVVGLALRPFAASVFLSFLLRQAWIKTGEIRWFALSLIPFYTVFLGRSIPLVARHANRELSDLLIVTTFGFAAVSVGFVLLRRYGRLRSERDRLHSEMLAAQQIQRLMLPATSLQVPHWHIETAYLPLEEVGGDFFQLSPYGEGGLLLLVGDVSGKGLQAALTMSLIVGFWQKLVLEADSPGEILRQLDHLIQTRVQNGFVTCLCARFEPDGRVIFANAGHLAPYWNGKELALSNGLPLGFGPVAAYDESPQILSPHDTLMFLTDGVVEARDKTRNLYGFDRVQQALTERLSAEALARRAQEFGQDDDITVISICRQPVEAKTMPYPQAAPIAL